MPPVDLETLLCGQGDSKVACESQIFVSSDDTVDEDPDLPPESVQVPIRDEILWAKLSKVLDRGGSTIGNANPKSSRSSPKPKTGSPRLNAGGVINSNGPIIVLPGKIQPSRFHGSVSHTLPTLGIFPLKFTIDRGPVGGGGRKTAVPEPGSPKVSCFGNVLSQKERKLCHRSSVVENDEEVEQGVRCWPSLAAILRYASGYPPIAGELDGDNSTNSSGNVSEEERKTATVTANATAPDLQGVKRYTSGRRPSSWAGDADLLTDGLVVSLEPLDRECALRLC